MVGQIDNIFDLFQSHAGSIEAKELADKIRRLSEFQSHAGSIEARLA